MKKMHIIAIGVVLTIWITFFISLSIPSFEHAPSIRQFLVIVGIAVIFVVVTEYFRPLRGK